MLPAHPESRGISQPQSATSPPPCHGASVGRQIVEHASRRPPGLSGLHVVHFSGHTSASTKRGCVSAKMNNFADTHFRFADTHTGFADTHDKPRRHGDCLLLSVPRIAQAFSYLKFKHARECCRVLVFRLFPLVSVRSLSFSRSESHTLNMKKQETNLASTLVDSAPHLLHGWDGEGPPLGVFLHREAPTLSRRPLR